MTPEDQWKDTTANWQGRLYVNGYYLVLGDWSGGRLARKLDHKREREGIVSYMAIGVVGALLGGILFRLLHLVAYGLLGELVVATVGAVILLFLLRKI